MRREWLTVIVVRREGMRRFEPRRVYVDPDDHKELIRHMREIARGVDRHPTGHDRWLGGYEMDVCADGSQVAMFTVSAIGEDVER